MSLPVDGNLDFQNVNKGINLPAPTSPGDVVNKAYVDAIAQGLDAKDAVRGTATTNVSLAAPGTIGAATAGQRVLLTAQTTASQNGLYIWNSGTTALTRTTDFATGSSQHPGVAAFDENTGTLWVMNTTSNVTVDTTAQSWTSIGQAVAYTGSGLITINGNVISLNNGSPIPVASGGTGSATAAGARAALSATGKYATTIGDNTTTTFTVTHGLGTTDVTVNIYDMASGSMELVQYAVTGVNTISVGAFGAAPATAGGTIGAGTGKRVVVTG